MSAKVINVCYVANELYAKYLPVSVYSLLSNIDENIIVNIFVLNNGDLSQESKQELKSVTDTFSGVNVEYIEIDNQLFIDLKLKPMFASSTYVAYYRLLIPRLIKQERVLMLDIDAIVVGNITEFYFQEFQNNYLVAVSETTSPLPNYLYYSEFDPLISKEHINVGVTLVNLAKIEEDKLGSDYLLNISQSDDIEFNIAEQWIFRTAYAGHIYNAERKYNWMISQTNDYDVNIRKNDIRIIQFLARYKPWYSQRNSRSGAIFWNIYDETLKLTPLRFKELNKIELKELGFHYHSKPIHFIRRNFFRIFWNTLFLIPRTLTKKFIN